MSEPRRCAECGSVVTCLCATCPACGRDSLRPLSKSEKAAWELLAECDPGLRRRGVAVRCGLAAQVT